MTVFLDTFHTATDGIGISPFRNIEFYKVAFGFNQNFVYGLEISFGSELDSGGVAEYPEERRPERIYYMSMTVMLHGRKYQHKIRISENQYRLAVSFKEINTKNPFVAIKKMIQKRKKNNKIPITLKAKLRNDKDK